MKKIVLISRRNRPKPIFKKLWLVYSIYVVRKSIFVRRLLK
jgi:hypothetical protein